MNSFCSLQSTLRCSPVLSSCFHILSVPLMVLSWNYSVVLPAQIDPLSSPLHFQVSSISLCMHPDLLCSLLKYLDLLCSFQCPHRADFSPLCILTSLFPMTSTTQIPTNTQILPIPSVRAQFLWAPLSDPFQSLCAPSIPLHQLLQTLSHTSQSLWEPRGCSDLPTKN